MHALLFGRFRFCTTIRDARCSDLGSGGVRSPVEEVVSPAVACLYFEAWSEWQLGESASCDANMAEAISLAKELNDMHGLALALYFAAGLAHFQRNPAEVERLASDLIALSTRHNFAYFLAGAAILRGWGAQRFRSHS